MSRDREKRRRRYEGGSDDDEEGSDDRSENSDEEGSGSDDGEIRRRKHRSHRHHHHHKKKSHKKEKKKRKKRKRSRTRTRTHTRSRSRSPISRRRREDLDEGEVISDDDEERDTDREGGSTPELDRTPPPSKRREREPTPIIIDVDNIEDGEIQHHSPTPPSKPPPPPPKETKRKPPPRRRSEDESGRGGGGGGGGNHVESLSIEETNKLRAKIGLPPLKVGDNRSKEEKEEDKNHEFADFELIPTSTIGERHKPPENLSQKTRAEKIKAKLAERREKRMREAKLQNIKPLGASDDEEEDAVSWVKKQERIVKEKEMAAKRAKMLEELDEEFGVGNIVEEELSKEKPQYGNRDLKGLKVDHSFDKFAEGQSVILTLKDADVLDEKADDTLINVNIVDEEKVEQNLDNIKKAKTGNKYNPYDQEEVDELTGELRKKNLLDKYDEEIEGEKTKKKGFAIGKGGVYNEDLQKKKLREEIRAKLQGTVISLAMPEPKVASDYYTPSEIVQFKKPKKKKKVKRRILKADDLLRMQQPQQEDHQKVPQQQKPDEDEDVGEVKDLSDVKVTVEDDSELQASLDRTRRLKEKIREKLTKKKVDIAEEILKRNEDETHELYESTGAELIGTFADDESANRNIVLNETSEFCRNLGAWQSAWQLEYQQQQQKEEKEEHSMLDGFGASLKSSTTKKFEENKKQLQQKQQQHQRGRWARVGDVKDDSSSAAEEEAEIVPSYQPERSPSPEVSTTILDEEPNLNKGVGAAIKLAVNKGYWEVEKKRDRGDNLKHLMAKNALIDDKRDDDRRGGRRHEDRYGGPTMPFQEKTDYVPNVKLEYIDDNGRKLSSKEAFRYLSHKFHGKTSGKIKTEKRMKKIMEETLMRNMASTDTPLGTVERMKQKQKETSTPYLIISGKNTQHPDLRK